MSRPAEIIDPHWVAPNRRRLLARRLLVGVLVLGTILFLSWRVLDFLRLNGLTPVEAGILAFFLILVIPLAISFWTAILGFVLCCVGGDSLELTRTLEDGSPDGPMPLTAIVLPVYNEDPARVMAGLKATYLSLELTGHLSNFEFFILSDTTNPDVWVREELAFVETRRQVSEPGRIFYRNRRQNTERKTGNIADFCASWGDRHKYMVVFDADSIMTGDSLVELVRLMERNPQAGILQAPPFPVNRTSLFGRLHQFATHVYGAVYLSGLNFWQGGTSNYWGHNAIIRIRPFIEHCRLPSLPGKPPLGGSILSHDFIEAAFMRRAGWRVHLVSQLGGSYEEMPSTLLHYAARDRRWCQGNLQHGRLLFAPGLRFINRLHIWLGIMAYLASPLWLLMMALTTIAGIRENVLPHQYFGTRRSLFPNWPADIARPALWLFGMVLGILLLPKFLGLSLHLCRRESRRKFGGVARLGLSFLLEILISTLLAPSLAWLHSRFVLSILLGSSAKWEVQDRGDAGTTWHEALKRHWQPTLLGLGWTGLLAVTAPRLLWWFSPVLLALILGIPLSVWTSQARTGLWARARGLFLIPEESAPPQILEDFAAALRHNAVQPWSEPGDPLARVLANPDLRELHLAMLPECTEASDPLQIHFREGLALKCRQQGPQALTLQEKRELLLDADVLLALCSAKAQPRMEFRSQTISALG